MNESRVIDALDQVLAWDMPAHLLPITLQSQAGLMAGVSNDELGCCFD
ncbi:MAG: hypothetical protein IPN00_05435 [Hydrogenophilales bacterium]|jgi:hypothetical protein|nr:hypothetical protein [Hydrogenophilales bacterium]